MENMDITPRLDTLPAKIEDLAKFVIYNSARLKGIIAGLSAIQKTDMPSDQYALLKEQGRIMQEEQLDAEVKLGEYFKGMEKNITGRPKKSPPPNGGLLTKEATTKDLGFTSQQVSRMETLANNKDIVEQIKAEARENGDIPRCPA